MTAEWLKAHLEKLSKLGALELRAEWTKVYRVTAPRHISRDLLLRGIAYRLQERMYGGLKPSTMKRLREIAEGLDKGTEDKPLPASRLKPGVRLLREWRGETHIVEVLPKGFAWKGKTYRSLSVIARTITGTHWSGPDFFGLRDKRKKFSIEPQTLIKALK
jgi:hypothetical protein